ncbi:MAG: GSCFA domain-containing protein [Paludibacteraceae bacterium]|nr:GSCFA domain-containing protein [Paludibacteraceae bacterium]
MKLYTSVEIAPSARKIGYGDKILLLGSCFADNIGAKFAEHYFQATINPLGTLYNPASIALSITDSQHSIPDSRLIYHNGLWHSMMHHGTFSGKDKAAVQARCMEGYERLQRALKEATTVIVTFGTAWVYEMDGQVVANCHKLPANRFTRRCLAVDEIVEMWQPIVASMPDKHWIFTVSPIRHVKDGLHANQVSKAILLQAVDELGQSYFPSYEIMMDELRDYRFYAEDMVHPSQVAVEYIWQRFVDTYMNADTQLEMRTLHQLWRDCHHQLLHSDSLEAKRFLQSLHERKSKYQKIYPWID